MERSSKQKIKAEIHGLTDIINQMSLTAIYKPFLPNTKQYNFFSVRYGIFSKTDYYLCHKANLSRYKNIETTQCILQDQHGLELNFKNSTKNRKTIQSWKLNNILISEIRIQTEIRKKFKKLPIIQRKMKEQSTQSHGTQ